MHIKGKIVNIPGRGIIIARFSGSVKTHSVVLDNRRKSLGKIFALMGPVGCPYVAIRSRKIPKNPLSLMGCEIYVEVE